MIIRLVRNVGPCAFPIDEERVAHLLRQRESRGALRLAFHAECAIVPVNIAPLSRRDITRAESEAGKQDQDGSIAHSPWGHEITGGQYVFNRFYRQILRQQGQSPVGHDG
jgi:hypothetical protein